MYQALYRKYRPQTFDDVVGQSAVTQTLKNQLQSGRLSHAYLFTGTRGTGKTSCAKILAKALNCTELQDGNPCNRCAACRAIDSGACTDVLEIDAASNNGVDQVRMLRDDAVYSPAQVKQRVYIIDEVHMLSLSAFNALLKIIEEPPAHLTFILATTELHKVPATILSRCQRFSFRRLLQEDIASRLNFIAYAENIDLESDACRLLARLADGGLRDGISLLDQCASSSSGSITPELVCGVLGLVGERCTAQLMDCISRGDSSAALRLFSSLYASGKDIAAMIDELTVLSRDLLILKTAPNSGVAMLSGIATDQEVSALAEHMAPAAILRITSVLQETAAGFSKSVNRRIDAELCILRLCEPALDLDLRSLNARIDRLEGQVASGRLVPAAAKSHTQSEEPPPPPDDGDAPPPPDQMPSHPSAASDDQTLSPAFVADFKARLKAQVPQRVTGFIPGVQLVLDKDRLMLAAENSFVKRMIDIPDVLTSSQQIASALLGRTIRVACEERSKITRCDGKKDPMDDLVSFGQRHNAIVTIKE